MENIAEWFVFGSIGVLMLALASEWLLFSSGRTETVTPAPAEVGFREAMSDVRACLTDTEWGDEQQRADNLVRLRQSWMKVKSESQCLSFEAYKDAILEVESLRSELLAHGIDPDKVAKAS